jgi:hypothetical protein
MNKLTNEQFTLFTAIGAGLLILCIIAFPAISLGYGISFTGLSLIGDAPFLAVLAILLMLLSPIYLLLYTYRDKPSLAQLKPIFVIKEPIVYILPVILAVIAIIYFAIEASLSIVGFGLWFYLVVSAALCYMATQLK